MSDTFKIRSGKEIVETALQALTETHSNAQLTAMAGNEIRRAQEQEFMECCSSMWKPACYMTMPASPITLLYQVEDWLKENSRYRYRKAYNQLYIAFENEDDAKKCCLYWNLKSG